MGKEGDRGYVMVMTFLAVMLFRIQNTWNFVIETCVNVPLQLLSGWWILNMLQCLLSSLAPAVSTHLYHRKQDNFHTSLVSEITDPRKFVCCSAPRCTQLLGPTLETRGKVSIL